MSLTTGEFKIGLRRLCPGDHPYTRDQIYQLTLAYDAATDAVKQRCSDELRADLQAEPRSEI